MIKPEGITPIGAGAIISSGRKARELTKINVNIKIAKMIKGAMYWRKKDMIFWKLDWNT
jgi:hypothetical protein